jgi:hypothetical protein
MEKYHNHPDRDRLVAREMGWTTIEEMLDADAELGPQGEADDSNDIGLDKAEPQAEKAEEDWVRHPLIERLIERSSTLMKLAEDKQDNDLVEMVGGFISVGPKVAGALGTVRLDRNLGNELNGLAVAKLKRALGELSRALNAADRLKERQVQQPFSIDGWVTEMLETRQEILTLMNEFR